MELGAGMNGGQQDNDKSALHGQEIDSKVPGSDASCHDSLSATKLKEKEILFTHDTVSVIQKINILDKPLFDCDAREIVKRLGIIKDRIVVVADAVAWEHHGQDFKTWIV